MEIQSGITTSTISLSSIVKATNGYGKVRFPVSQSSLINAGFKNINLVPSFGDTGSYSVSSLRVLDNLIEQLNRMNGKNGIEIPGLSDIDDQNLLISELSGELHTKLKTDTPYNFTVESSGFIINLLV